MNPHRGLLHHLNLMVSDVLKSSAFYTPVLTYLGYELCAFEHTGDWPWEDWGRWELDTPHILGLSRGDATRPIDRDAQPAIGRFSHLAFAAADRADVDRFHATVLVPLAQAGLCTIEDPPVDCPEYGEGYYATFFRDPDGIKFEFVITPGYFKKRAARLLRKSM